jgi:hypothetical protein
MAVPVTGGLFFDLPLPVVVIGHEGGTLLVVLTGLRLLADPIRARSPARRGVVRLASSCDFVFSSGCPSEE